MAKMAPLECFGELPPGRLGEGKELGVEGMEGKMNGDHLRLIPGLCLEDRTN